MGIRLLWLFFVGEEEGFAPKRVHLERVFMAERSALG